MRLFLSALFLVALGLWSTSISAEAEITIRSSQVKVTAPHGLLPADRSVSKVWEKFLALTPEGLTPLAIFITPGDMAREMGGDDARFDRYATMQVPEVYASFDVTTDQFESLRTMILDQHKQLLEELREVIAEKTTTALSEYFREQVHIDFGQVVPVEVVQNFERSIGVLILTRYDHIVDGVSYPDVRVMGMATVLVAGQPVNFNLYSRFTDDADIEWVRDNLAAWVQGSLAIQTAQPPTVIPKPSTVTAQENQITPTITSWLAGAVGGGLVIATIFFPLTYIIMRRFKGRPLSVGMLAAGYVLAILTIGVTSKLARELSDSHTLDDFLAFFFPVLICACIVYALQQINPDSSADGRT